MTQSGKFIGDSRRDSDDAMSPLEKIEPSDNGEV